MSVVDTVVATWAVGYGVIAVDNVENRRHHQKWVTRWVVGVAKKIFFIRPVGIAFNEHGGKTGRAMIKYPLYRKNAQRKNTLAYPGLTTVSFDRIINLCLTTMF